MSDASLSVLLQPQIAVTNTGCDDPVLHLHKFAVNYASSEGAPVAILKHLLARRKGKQKRDTEEV